MVYYHALGRAKFWNIVIFSHIVVNWGKIMRKSFVTAHIVQTCAPGTYLNITGWTNQRAEDPKQPIRGQNSIILRWIPGAQVCTMWVVTTHFLFILPQLTTIWLNITMVQNFARPTIPSIILDQWILISFVKDFIWLWCRMLWPIYIWQFQLNFVTLGCKTWMTVKNIHYHNFNVCF